jgi:uncharacterized phage-associated protein
MVRISMAYDGRQVANFILDFCERNDRPITNLALQKILYFCHVWSLVRLGRPLVKHRFEAWPLGPVLQYVYHEFKRFDQSPISSRALKFNVANGKKEVVSYSFDNETEELLLRVVDFYSRLSSGQLVGLSHVSDGPWAKVWNHKGKINPGMEIDDGEIKGYYSRANQAYESFSADRG